MKAVRELAEAGKWEKIRNTKLVMDIAKYAVYLGTSYLTFSAVSYIWGQIEGVESVNIAQNKVISSGSIELKKEVMHDAAVLMEDELNNPHFPFTPAWTTHNIKTKFKGNKFAFVVGQKLLADNIFQEENGLTTGDMILRNSIEIAQLKKEHAAEFNEDKIHTEEIILAMRKQAAKESDRRALQNLAAQIKLWEEYAERQRILERQEREAMAEFWLAYRKRKGGGSGGFGFGLL